MIFSVDLSHLKTSGTSMKYPSTFARSTLFDSPVLLFELSVSDMSYLWRRGINNTRTYVSMVFDHRLFFIFLLFGIGAGRHGVSSSFGLFFFIWSFRFGLFLLAFLHLVVSGFA